ncbi:MAG TPA: hypothetical protein PJ982_02705 [Lacipirellulaceae bacterium]|nr:hypothetical protein [Lacipirellulaceae bacterium]
MLVVASLAGCGGYGPMSETGYRFAASLYAVCNRQSPEKLEEAAAQLAAAEAAGELPASEARWLEAIVDQGRQGRWAEGAAAARRMMRDQATR